jgi:putative SOS response-associated peptidase YedK
MCGRYYIDQEDSMAEMRQILETVNRRYKGSRSLEIMKTGEVSPSDVVPVVRLKSEESGACPTAQLLRWGFVGYRQNQLIINARSETAHEKPLFREAVRHGRVLIPANAFFEWQRRGRGMKSIKMKVSSDTAGTFYMAGLARLFPEPVTEDPPLARFVILTVPANETVRAVHDRMPLLIPRAKLRDWLEDDDKARAMMQSPAEQQLHMIAVS